jgi:hypothetical protein
MPDLIGREVCCSRIGFFLKNGPKYPYNTSFSRKKPFRKEKKNNKLKQFFFSPKTKIFAGIIHFYLLTK